jgi:hypothetical protein
MPTSYCKFLKHKYIFEGVFNHDHEKSTVLLREYQINFSALQIIKIGSVEMFEKPERSWGFTPTTLAPPTR